MSAFGRLLKKVGHLFVERPYVVPLLFLTVASICFWSIPAFSQTRTGSVAGFVRSPDGVVIENADVKVVGVEATRNVKTDKRGYYLVPSLPPGEYTVTVEASGTGATVYKGLVITISSAARLDLTIRSGVSVRENVTVSAEALPVESSESKTSTVVSHQVLDSLPIVNRDFMQSLKVIPGVSGSGDSMSISGGEDAQKNYNIDGVDNNDLAQGRASSSGFSMPSNKSLVGFDQESIQELSVATSGYSADQGYGSGGLINVKTKSGTDQLHGSAYMDARHSQLDSAPNAYRNYFFGGSLGGLIKKDKLYYFINLGSTINANGFDNRSTAYALVPSDTTNKTKTVNSFGKLTWKLTPNQTLNLSANISKSFGDLLTVTYRPPSEFAPYNQDVSNVLATIAHTAVLNPSTVLDSTLAYGDVNTEYAIGAGVHAGTIINYPSFIWGGTSQGSYWLAKDKVFWAEKLTHTFRGDGWISNHTISTGFDYRWYRYNDERNPQESIYTYDPNYYPPTYMGGRIQYKNIVDAYHFATTQGYFAGYFADQWRVHPRLILNAGIRVSRDTFLSDVVAEPRIGFAWDPAGDGKTVVRGGFNLYSDRVNLFAQQLANGPLARYEYLYRDGTVISRATAYRIYTISPNLDNPRTYEGSFGVERELFAGVVAGVNYTYRDYEGELLQRYGNLLDPVTLERPDPTKGYTIEMQNEGFSKYHGILASIRKTGKGRYQIMASYSYQRSRGNTSWFAGMGSQNIQLDDPSTYTTDDVQVVDKIGRTDYDRPYDFKLYGMLNLPKRFMVSGVMNWTAGAPFTTYNGMTGEFVSSYQGMRMPHLFTLDMRLQKDFHITERLNLAFTGQAFNMTNRKNVLWMGIDQSQLSQYLKPSQLDSARRIQLGTRFTF